MPLRFRILPLPKGSAAAPASTGALPWAVDSQLSAGPAEERTFELAGDVDEVRIGRQPGTEIELPFPSVSSLHTRIFSGELPTDWWVEDLGSTNGTWVDGQKLAPNRPSPLRPGQRLRIATIDIVFEGWSAKPLGAESTASIARRLISDLFGMVGGEVPSLTVEGGRGRPPKLSLAVRDRRYLAGRADGCDMVLTGEQISREHAAFVRLWDGVVVFDLESKNGVLLNGTAVPGQAKVRDGDRIGVGSVEMALADPEERYLRQLASLAAEPPVADTASGSVTHLPRDDAGMAAAAHKPVWQSASDTRSIAENVPRLSSADGPLPAQPASLAPDAPPAQAPAKLGVASAPRRLMIALMVLAVSAVVGLLVLLFGVE